MEHLEETAALLSVKECDLRSDALYQCGTSVDKGIHIGGAYSAIPIMSALFYGGFMDYDVGNPTSADQDLFILSKGHAVAALAAVYADLGYIDRAALAGSRGWGALVKGHPGPVIPGVPVATGPLGHGISLAAGYALRRREDGRRNVFCLVGDGELQEGSCWEGLMFAGDRRLSNLCVVVDKNGGQSDSTQFLSVGVDGVGRQAEAFGFRVLDADSADPAGLLRAFESFASFPRDPRPTLVVCRSTKGIGGFSAATGKHKTSFSDAELERENRFLAAQRERRSAGLGRFAPEVLSPIAERIGYRCRIGADGRVAGVDRVERKPSFRRPAPRLKALEYDAAELPRIDPAKEYAAFDIISASMAAFARDPRLYTVDADLSNASGLYDGTRAANAPHAINVGIAECNMMCIAEALASEGAIAWVSTFAPFFDWRALRRIAVGYQEREEVIADPRGWLSEGHNADIAFIATAANLDTGVNGATHMGNDDNLFFGQLAHLKIVDVSCPRQLLAVLRWIAEGNRGLVYVRVMRNKSRVLYGPDYRFEYGKGQYLRNPERKDLVIVSSGHGVLEALDAAELLERESGISAAVADLPSFDPELLSAAAAAGTPLVFAEQNNGALFDAFARHALRNGVAVAPDRVARLSATELDGRLRFIQSGTYGELVRELGLAPADIAAAARKLLRK